MLEQMWTLGVRWLRPTPVVVSGAAARGGEWEVSRSELRAAIREFEARRGTAMRIDLRGGNAGSLADVQSRPPASMLVRPGGAVRIDSLLPFSFGNAAADGVAACWERIRGGWRDERIVSWAGSLQHSTDLAESELVPYLDNEIEIAGESGEAPADTRDAPLPAPAPLPQVDPDEDFAAASRRIGELALARRYRWAPLRTGGGEEPRIVRRSFDGRYVRLNRAASAAMDALDGGTPAEAAARLAGIGAPAGSATDDALAATRELLRLGVVTPAGGDGSPPAADPGPSDLPGLEPTGEET